MAGAIAYRHVVVSSNPNVNQLFWDLPTDATYFSFNITNGSITRINTGSDRFQPG